MLVIGDHIADIFNMGKSTRLSPEAPVPVITDVETFYREGGAGNVVQNLRALGEDPVYLCNPAITSTKIRYYANGQMICRIDNETYQRYNVDLSTVGLGDHTYAILSDYAKGVLHDPEKLIAKLKNGGVKCLVDPKLPLGYYQGAYLIKCNESEFADHVGHREFDADLYMKACESQCTLKDFKYIIVTLGADGCFLYDHTWGAGYYIGAEAHHVSDVTGAGDVFMAALAHFLQSGDQVLEATKKANALAGISVEHLGTYVLTREDIARVAKKEKVVFTNGCFDILHPGHIHLLKESKKLGDKLIVGLNSDESIKRIKGPQRPILNQDQRKKMLEALEIADEVIIFEEDSPRYLILQVKPDIITKGGDYKPEDVVGHDLANVVIIPTLENYSTTGVVNEIIRKS